MYILKRSFGDGNPISLGNSDFVSEFCPQKSFLLTLRFQPYICQCKFDTICSRLNLRSQNILFLKDDQQIKYVIRLIEILSGQLLLHFFFLIQRLKTLLISERIHFGCIVHMQDIWENPKGILFFQSSFLCVIFISRFGEFLI